MTDVRVSKRFFNTDNVMFQTHDVTNNNNKTITGFLHFQAKIVKGEIKKLQAKEKNKRRKKNGFLKNNNSPEQ